MLTPPCTKYLYLDGFGALLSEGLEQPRQRLGVNCVHLEGRRSIQLSYGRNRIDSKTFALSKALSFRCVDPLRK
jgi:hypothetical protein